MSSYVDKDYFYYFNTNFIVNGSTRSNEIEKRKTKSAKDRFNAQRNEGLRFIDRYDIWYQK